MTDRETDRLTDRETRARVFKERGREGETQREGKVFRERESAVFRVSGGRKSLCSVIDLNQ